MATRLGSDDLEFLNAVRGMGAAGLSEDDIAEGLATTADELRERMARIRLAFLTLTEVTALATGERLAQAADPWEIVFLTTAF